MRNLASVLTIVTCILALATFASGQEQTTPSAPDETTPPIPPFPTGLPFGRKKRHVTFQVIQAPTTAPETSSEQANKESTDRKKRLVVYTVRDLIEKKYTRF